MTEPARIAWFDAGSDRPVNGSGNTVYVRPADTDEPEPDPLPEETPK